MAKKFKFKNCTLYYDKEDKEWLLESKELGTIKLSEDGLGTATENIEVEVVVEGYAEEEDFE